MVKTKRITTKHEIMEESKEEGVYLDPSRLECYQISK